MKSDTELLDFLEANPQYCLGFAPSGSWSCFTISDTSFTCYGDTIRECLMRCQVMHEDIESRQQ